MKPKSAWSASTWRSLAATLIVLVAPAFGAHAALAQDNSSVSPPELHASVPPAMAEATTEHPLYGSVLSLAGTLALGGADDHPTVWIKATQENGRITLYTTPQLESLGYQVRMPSPNQIVLLYGPVRLVVRNTGTM